MATLYDSEIHELENAIMAKVPKTVHLLLNDPTALSETENLKANSIITQAAQYLTKTSPEIQTLLTNYNQKHPEQLYDITSFAMPHTDLVKQGITNQFTHSLEIQKAAKTSEPNIEAAITKPSTLKHR